MANPNVKCDRQGEIVTDNKTVTDKVVTDLVFIDYL